MQAHVAPAQRSDEHFTLYQRYLGARHAGAGMDNPAPEDFDQFLRSRWSQTRFLELRRGKRLRAVAVTDELPTALSAVSPFFELELTSAEPHRGKECDSNGRSRWLQQYKQQN